MSPLLPSSSSHPSGGQVADEILSGLRHALLDRIWRGLTWVCVLSMPLSIFQYMDHPVDIGVVIHVLLTLLCGAMVRYRARLTLNFKASVLVISCFAVGAFGLSRFGLMGAEWFYVVLGVIVAGMVLSDRMTLLIWLGALGILGFFMWSYGATYVQLQVNPVKYHMTYQPWLLLMLASVMLPAFVLRQHRENQYTLYSLLQEVGRQRDIIAEQVYIDDLTGLPSRKLMMDRLNMAIGRLARVQECAAALFLDLDGFKAANDTHGHAAGDRVLKVVSERMRQSLRGDDTVARYAGDEFVVVLNNVGEEGHALDVASRLLAEIERPIDYDGRNIQVSASIGVRVFSHGEDVSAEMLILQADEAMYRAKQQGKGRALLFR